MSQEDEANNFDLINVSGPLTIEAILKALQQRFNNGHRYVSFSYSLTASICLLALPGALQVRV